MENLLSPSNITFAIGIIGVIFTIYNYFKNPQIDSDKRDALLAQQIKSMIEANEFRFKTLQESFNGMLLQSNNHIHTVDTKVEALNATVTAMTNQITKLATIIEERIPKKNIRS